MEHSRRFDVLKEKYELGYIDIEKLKYWVEANFTRYGKGITTDEFLEITGYQYEPSEVVA